MSSDIFDSIDFLGEHKTYKNCPFRLEIPKLYLYDDNLLLEFCIHIKMEYTGFLFIDFCKITNKNGKMYCGYNKYKFSNKDNNFKQTIKIEIPIDNKNFYIQQYELCISILSEINYKYYVVYNINNNFKAIFSHIVIDNMYKKDIKNFYNAILYSKNLNTVSSNAISNDENKFINKDLEIYKKAILKEMIFLKNNGGRKYKVTNGMFINCIQGFYTYSFDIEAELNLPDDTPITATTMETKASGSVFVCDGFQIIVIIDRDLGKKISSAYINIEPWKLLEALKLKLDLISKNDKLAIKLLEEGPKLSIKENLTNIKKGYENVKKTSLCEDISVIWGPPGTGKTYTMSELAIEFAKQGKSVLIVSHSNISVDGVIKKIIELIKKYKMELYLTRGKILRYGYVKDNELSESKYAVAFNYALDKNQDLKKKLKILMGEKDRYNIKYNSSKYMEIEEEIKSIRTTIKEQEQYFAEKAQILATTISKVTIDKIFEDKKYDVVMFDEVSMAYVPQLVCAAMYAKEHFIAVGDFRQLAPISQSDAKNILSEDIFSYLKISSGDNNINNHKWLVMLDEQRRMNPEISYFPSKYIYNGLLKDHKSIKESYRNKIQNDIVNLINLSGTYCSSGKNNDNSRFNILSAIVCFATAIKFEKSGEDSIGIISPYVAQTRLIRAMIQDYDKELNTHIVCSTVHQFQGSERNIIIFDGVESYPPKKTGWLMSRNENGSVTRLINVAITRAKNKLITIANLGYWQNHFLDTKNIFYKFLSYQSVNSNVLDMENNILKEYFSNLYFGNNIKYFKSIEESIFLFKKDIECANDKIVISLPNSNLDEYTQSIILDLVCKAKEKNIKILVKSMEYINLNNIWKKFCYISENAIFPIIIIDDSILWYGLPLIKKLYSYENQGFSFLLPTIFRIVGNHTIEIIKSLTDIEYRVIDSQRKPLLEKNEFYKGLDDNKNLFYRGLEKFISEHKKCIKCQNHLILSKNKLGRYFLRCNSCKHIEYINSDFINWYINTKEIKCPIHNCNVQAGLGKYGVYVKCDTNHFLKLEEI